ncbi:putative hemolysin activator domain protein [Acinetobacter baumannii 96512]|nr:putative hemolysin activator domain protein [Acinetobacter baumannii 1552818]EXG19759.1 putative hemolysin activator domain protein [Acinetobacter baumannii 470922]KCX30656.1 putative hemolysin activator domain protein [Acinetobacter baumannii 96512]
MLTKNFITSSIILFAGFHQYVYAIEDVSLPSQVLQDQRLKELNQQLQDQLAQQTPYQNTSHYRTLSIWLLKKAHA